MSLLYKGISLIFIFVQVAEALETLYLLEGGETILVCKTYESSWLVTSNGHSRIVSACQTKYFNCTNNESESYQASFVSWSHYKKFGCYNTSFCHSLWIRNASVGITRISCKANEWELRVRTVAPDIQLLANNRSYVINVLSCTKVTFTCMADIEPGTKLTLYMDSVTNVLAVDYHPNTISHPLTFYQDEFHTVFCSVNNLLRNIRVYVSTAGLPRVNLLANNVSDVTDVQPCSEVNFVCKVDDTFGCRLFMFMDNRSNILVEARDQQFIINYRHTFYLPGVYTIYCTLNTVASKVIVSSATSPVNLTADKLVIYSGDNITFNCQACGAKGTLLTLETVKGNRVLAQAELPGAINYTMERVQSDPMFLNVKCRTWFYESQVLITVHTCKVRHVIFTANRNLGSIEVTPNSSVQLACEAEADIGEAIVISEHATGLVLSESKVPQLILHTMTNFSCGTSLRLQCQVCYNVATRQTVEIRVSPCDLTAGYQTTTEITTTDTPFVEIIVGASLGSWALLVVAVFVLFIWFKRRRHRVLIPPSSNQQSDTAWATTEISNGEAMEPPSYSELMLKLCVRPPEYIHLPPTYDEAVYFHERGDQLLNIGTHV